MWTSGGPAPCRPAYLGELGDQATDFVAAERDELICRGIGAPFDTVVVCAAARANARNANAAMDKVMWAYQVSYRRTR
jgi:hypothetical protein